MSKGKVKNKRDEVAWQKAKDLVCKQYPELSEDDDAFWKVHSAIYASVRKARTTIKKDLLLKSTEAVALFCTDVSAQKDLALETYLVLYHLFNSEKVAIRKAKTIQKPSKAAGKKKRRTKPKSRKVTGKTAADELDKAARKLQGRIDFHGMKISIENKKGSVRKGTDPNGHEWKVKMKYPYGYIRLTEGADGEHVDCYVGDNREPKTVYVINQVDPYKDDHPFDEQKVMLGFDSAETAKKAYLMHYDRPDFFGNMYEYPMDTFIENIGVGKKDKPNLLLKRKKGKIK